MKWKLVPEEPTNEMAAAFLDAPDTAEKVWGAMLSAAPQPEHDRMTKEEAQAIQDWKGIDGAIAFHLIERHADGWHQVGEMMEAWLEANRGHNV